jgi:hypothetical protein
MHAIMSAANAGLPSERHSDDGDDGEASTQSGALEDGGARLPPLPPAAFVNAASGLAVAVATGVSGASVFQSSRGRLALGIAPTSRQRQFRQL